MNIEIILGDITQQSDCEAIVNAANPNLIKGAGVAGAIHKAAGNELEKYCEQYAPIKTSEAVISPGFKLPNQYVIHAVGPKYYQDQNPEELLMQTYQNVLKICIDNQIKNIATPAISTGSYGFPVLEAAEITYNTLSNWNDSYPKKVRICVFDESTYKTFIEISTR
jgi:O-acetyl-ADP-ribose deacetylase